MAKFVLENEREVEVKMHCQVAVVGGGFAGIAAALSAARDGADVILIEQQYSLGGMATLGMITHYLPLCDGYGTQVSYGIAEELLCLSASLDEDPDVKAAWKRGLQQKEAGKAGRLIYEFNPSIFSILTEKLLLSEGVRIVYGASVCAVSMQDGRITNLLVEGRDGRWGIDVDTVVDCSGDAVVCRVAGAKTKVFQQQNLVAAWYAATDDGVFRVMPLGCADIPDEYKTEEQKREERKTKKRYPGTTTQDLTEFMIDAHSMILKDFLKRGKLGQEHALAAIPAIPEIRMTRKIVGRIVLEEARTPTRFEDSVGMISNWKERGPIFELPFSCLFGDDVKNLITAGRCISVSDTMWDVTRVIPPCAVSGEAAGLAASMFSDFAAADIGKLQEALKKRCIPLHIDELDAYKSVYGKE